MVNCKLRHLFIVIIHHLLLLTIFFFQGFFFTAIISYQYSLCFQKIYIPGDNDIGGEFRDFRTQKKVDRFVKHFENLTGVTTFGFIDYIKVYMCS